MGAVRVAAVLAAASMLACGLNMEVHYKNYRSDLVRGNAEAADRYIDGKKEEFYGEGNRLLYYMDKGMVLHLAKRYPESNQYLEKAKAAAEELWTDSVGENAEAWLTTDNSISYQGEDFEKVMLHFVAALNYLELRDFSAARVEARQVTNRLELFNSKYEEGAKNTYRDDAFARWLAGKLSETEGREGLNDAWIDYEKALTVYKQDYARYRTAVPTYLVEDALRALDGLGADFAQELAELRGEYPSVGFTPYAESSKLGQVVVLHLAGEAPYKIDKFWTAKAGDEVLRIAYPEMVAKSPQITRARVSVAGRDAPTQLGENLTAIAIQNLNDRMGRIKTKAIARSVAKVLAARGLKAGGQALSHQGGKAGNAGQALQVAGVLWNVGSAIAEEADKRSWLSLPAMVNVAQTFVPAGPVSVRVDFLSPGGSVVRSTTLSGEVKAGETLFLPVRTFE
jgi:uncharacterized protein